MTEGQQSDDQEPQQKEPLQLGGDNAPVTGLETMNTQTVPPAESKEDDQESESGDAAAGAAKGESSKKLENKSLHSSIHDSQVQVAFTGSNIGTLIVQQGGGHESRERELTDKEAKEKLPASASATFKKISRK